MHDRFLVANGQTVWTGSCNLTTDGGDGDNHDAVQIQSPQRVAANEAECARM